MSSRAGSFLPRSKARRRIPEQARALKKYVGGIAVMGLNLVLLLVSLVILLLNGGHYAQPLDFTASPNPGYQSGLAMLSFVVFAIFAYGGIEAVGG